jgi:long-chain acyl-CoA synthetase
MLCTPRVFDKVYATVMGKISSESLAKRAAFATAYWLQHIAISHLGHRLHLLDKAIFNKIKEKMGGQLQRILSGGSPLTVQTYDFMRICFSDSGLMQGYGLTETAAATCLTFPDDHVLSVGSPCPSVEIMLGKELRSEFRC